MSLLVEPADGDGWMRPLATEIDFVRRWRPLCERLGLQWVPLFQSGLPIRPEDVSDIVAELRQIEVTLSTPGEDAELLERVRRLIVMLEAVDFAAGESAYIG